MATITTLESEAWDYLNRWAEKSVSERVRQNVKSGHEPVEDALLATAELLRVDPGPESDAFVGRVAFTALGDSIRAELYHPLRILYGVVPHLSNGMPMQGLLSTRRVFENETSHIHVGPDGELYRPGLAPIEVNPEPMDTMSKLATLAYFEARAEVLAPRG